MEHSEKELLQRLKEMKKELNVKQRKLEKSKRATNAKSHVRQKVQEQYSGNCSSPVKISVASNLASRFHLSELTTVAQKPAFHHSELTTVAQKPAFHHSELTTVAQKPAFHHSELITLGSGQKPEVSSCKLQHANVSKFKAASADGSPALTSPCSSLCATSPGTKVTISSLPEKNRSEARLCVGKKTERKMEQCENRGKCYGGNQSTSLSLRRATGNTGLKRARQESLGDDGLAQYDKAPTLSRYRNKSKGSSLPAAKCNTLCLSQHPHSGTRDCLSMTAVHKLSTPNQEIPLRQENYSTKEDLSVHSEYVRNNGGVSLIQGLQSLNKEKETKLNDCVPDRGVGANELQNQLHGQALNDVMTRPGNESCASGMANKECRFVTCVQEKEICGNKTLMNVDTDHCEHLAQHDDLGRRVARLGVDADDCAATPGASSKPSQPQAASASDTNGPDMGSQHSRDLPHIVVPVAGQVCHDSLISTDLSGTDNGDNTNEKNIKRSFSNESDDDIFKGSQASPVRLLPFGIRQSLPLNADKSVKTVSLTPSFGSVCEPSINKSVETSPTNGHLPYMQEPVTDSEFFNILGLTQNDRDVSSSRQGLAADVSSPKPQNCSTSSSLNFTGNDGCVGKLNMNCEQGALDVAHASDEVMVKQLSHSPNVDDHSKQHCCGSPTEQLANFNNGVPNELDSSQTATENSFLEYTELDVIPYSQFELTEDFLSETQHSQASVSKGCHRAGALVKRRSSRISSLGFAHSSSVDPASSLHPFQLGSELAGFACATPNQTQKSLSQQQRSASILSAFQFLKDEAKKTSSSSEFGLPSVFNALKVKNTELGLQLPCCAEVEVNVGNNKESVETEGECSTCINDALNSDCFSDKDVRRPFPSVGKDVGRPSPSVGKDVGRPSPSVGKDVGKPSPSVGKDVGRPSPCVGKDVGRPSPSVGKDVGRPFPSVDKDVGRPSPSVGKDVGRPSLSVGKDVGRPSPSVGKDVGRPSPSVGKDVGRPSLSVGKDVGRPSPSVGKDVGRPSLSVGKDVGRPSPSVGRPSVGKDVGRPSPSVGKDVGRPSPSVGKEDQAQSLTFTHGAFDEASKQDLRSVDVDDIEYPLQPADRLADRNQQTDIPAGDKVIDNAVSRKGKTALTDKGKEQLLESTENNSKACDTTRNLGDMLDVKSLSCLETDRHHISGFGTTPSRQKHRQGSRLGRRLANPSIAKKLFVAKNAFVNAGFHGLRHEAFNGAIEHSTDAEGLPAQPNTNKTSETLRRDTEASPVFSYPKGLASSCPAGLLYSDQRLETSATSCGTPRKPNTLPMHSPSESFNAPFATPEPELHQLRDRTAMLSTPTNVFKGAHISSRNIEFASPEMDSLLLESPHQVTPSSAAASQLGSSNKSKVGFSFTSTPKLTAAYRTTSASSRQGLHPSVDSPIGRAESAGLEHDSPIGRAESAGLEHDSPIGRAESAGLEHDSPIGRAESAGLEHDSPIGIAESAVLEHDSPLPTACSPSQPSSQDLTIASKDHRLSSDESYLSPAQIPVDGKDSIADSSLVSSPNEHSTVSPYKTSSLLNASINIITPWKQLPKTASTPVLVLEREDHTSCLGIPMFSPIIRRSRCKAPGFSRSTSLPAWRFAGCFQGCAQDAVVSLLTGVYKTQEGKMKHYIVSVQATSLTVWTEDDLCGWTAELDWRLSLDMHVMKACLLPRSDSLIAVVASGWDKQDLFATLFVYDCSTENTCRFNIPVLGLQPELKCPTQIELCPALASELHLAVTSESHHTVGRVVFSHLVSGVQSSSMFGLHRGKLIGLVTLDGQASADVSLTQDQQVALWNMKLGVVVKKIKLQSSLPCLTGLLAATSYKGLCLLDTVWRLECGHCGGVIAVNPMTGQAKKVVTFPVPNSTWRSVDSAKVGENLVTAISDKGSLGIWHRQSGVLLGHTRSKISTCASLMIVEGQAKITGLFLAFFLELAPLFQIHNQGF